MDEEVEKKSNEEINKREIEEKAEENKEIENNELTDETDKENHLRDNVENKSASGSEQEEIKENNENFQKEKLAEKTEHKNSKGEGSFKPVIFVMLASLAIAGLWERVPAIKNFIHAILDPTAGSLLSWNVSWGMVVIVLIITIITTLVQKYATDQETLKELKKEQKGIQKQMKEFKHHPEKLMELQKKQFALMPKQMKLSMRALAYTGIPFILFFRWFYDFFALIENVKFFGITKSWFLVYIVFAMIFSSILRKWWDVV